jgi:hypothetical protein
VLFCPCTNAANPPRSWDEPNLAAFRAGVAGLN